MWESSHRESTTRFVRLLARGGMCLTMSPCLSALWTTQAYRMTLVVKNDSHLPQKIGFVESPSVLEVQPYDGFVVMMPLVRPHFATPNYPTREVTIGRGRRRTSLGLGRRGPSGWRAHDALSSRCEADHETV